MLSMTTIIWFHWVNGNKKNIKTFLLQKLFFGSTMVFMKSPTKPVKRPIYIDPINHTALKTFAASNRMKLTEAANMAVVAMTSKPTRKAAAK